MKKTIKDLEIESDKLAFEIAELQKKRSKIIKSIKELKLNNNEVHVTDHAIVRYLERVIGMDTDEIRKKMINHTLIDMVRKVGTKNFVCPIDNFQVVVEDRSVITIHKD